MYPDYIIPFLLPKPAHLVSVSMHYLLGFCLFLFAGRAKAEPARQTTTKRRKRKNSASSANSAGTTASIAGTASPRRARLRRWRADACTDAGRRVPGASIGTSALGGSSQHRHRLCPVAASAPLGYRHKFDFCLGSGGWSSLSMASAVVRLSA